MKYLTTKKPGYVLVFVLTLMAIMFVLTTVSFNLVHYEATTTNRSYSSRQALNLAESGIEQAIRALNANSNYPGETNTTLGNGMFTTTVTGTGASRTITSVGYIPNATDPRVTRTVKAEAILGGTSAEFFYGIQVDGGGVSINNSSSINGNVYSNGNIIGTNSGTITGDATVAGAISDTPTIEHVTSDADQFFATTNDNRDIAQSFTATASDNLSKISLLLAKVGDPSSNLTVRLAADVGGQPDTASIASSVIPHVSVGSTPSWIDVTFSALPALTNGTKYWIVLDYNSHSDTNHWNWRKDSSNSYANNTGVSSSNCCSGSPTWTNVGGDLIFRVWIGGAVTRIEGMTIGGTARANQFVNTSVHGSNCPNPYCIISNPAGETLPISDGNVADWQADALAGGTLTGDYTLSGTEQANLGPKKIVGNLTVTNSAILTMTGTLWVTGNVSFTNSAIVRLDSGYGSNSGIIIADGTITVANTVQFQGADVGSYVLLLTTRDAKNETSIFVSNNSTGVIYYAGRSWIQFTNTASAKEATAWGIRLDNNSSITYESGLANTNFTSGPGGGWSLKKGSWRNID